MNITLSMAYSVQWELFTIFAALLIYNGYTNKNPGEKMLRFSLSFLFWIASLSTWISDGNSYVPMLALIAPTLLSLVWALQALGAYTDKPYKRNIYD